MSIHEKNIHLEKCKTIGDAYIISLAIGGPRIFSHRVPTRSPFRKRATRPSLHTRRTISPRGTTYQLTPYRHGATALTDRLTRNSSWSSAGSWRGEVNSRGSRKSEREKGKEILSLSYGLASSSDYVRSLLPACAFALRHHLVVDRRTLAGARRFTTPVVDKREGTKRARETGKERGGDEQSVQKGSKGGRSAKAGIWGRGCKICCRNGVANECGRPVD